MTVPIMEVMARIISKKMVSLSEVKKFPIFFKIALFSEVIFLAFPAK
jgi:hypothetical protein